MYILPGGSVAAVDRNFVDWFGQRLQDVLGQHVASLVMDPPEAAAAAGASSLSESGPVLSPSGLRL